MQDTMVSLWFVFALLALLGGFVAYMFGRIASVRAECLEATSDVGRIADEKIDKVRAERVAAETRLHARVDEICREMVDKDDIKAVQDQLSKIQDLLMRRDKPAA